jgi:hypothetical protein
MEMLIVFGEKGDETIQLSIPWCSRVILTVWGS